MAVSLRCGRARRRRLTLGLQREGIMAAVIGGDQRQNGDRADDGEEIGEDETHQRDDRDEGEDRPDEHPTPFRLLGGTPVACAEIIANACADAMADVAHDVVVQLALEASAPRLPIAAPLIPLLVTRLLPLPAPFAALLAPFAIGFVPRGVIRVARAIAAPAVAAFCWRLCRFRVVGREIFSDADSNFCHVLTP